MSTVAEGLRVGVGQFYCDVEVAFLVDDLGEGLDEVQFILILFLAENLRNEGLVGKKGNLVQLAVRLQGDPRSARSF